MSHEIGPAYNGIGLGFLFVYCFYYLCFYHILVRYVYSFSFSFSLVAVESATAICLIIKCVANWPLNTCWVKAKGKLGSPTRYIKKIRKINICTIIVQCQQQAKWSDSNCGQYSCERSWTLIVLLIFQHAVCMHRHVIKVKASDEGRSPFLWL